MQVTDVDDDNADEDLQGDAGDEQGEDEVVELVPLAADVEQQFELSDLGHGEYRHQSALSLGLGLL